MKESPTTGAHPIEISPSSMQMQSGEFLRRYRRRAGMSQRILGKVLDINDSSISKFESGERRLPFTPEFYERLLLVPGVTEEDVLGLMAAKDGPLSWLANPEVKEGDITVTLRPHGPHRTNLDISFPPPPGILRPEEMTALKTMVRENTRLTVSAFMKYREGKLGKIKKTTVSDDFPQVQD